MKILLAPDSFKGSLSAPEVVANLREGILRVVPEAQVDMLPVADGGEGTCMAIVAALGGEIIEAEVTGPNGNRVNAYFGRAGDMAIIEMAAASGLHLAPRDALRPREATTYGTGELMLHALNAGCKRVLLGIGGSATTDGGAGMAQALGVRFLDEAGEEFVPVGENLARVAKIDMSGLLPALRGIEVITMCDIDNPLCGKNGAAHIFGPQKGADPAMVEYLDGQLSAIARTVGRELGRDVADLPGAGAAGGMGGGMVAFLGSRLQMGIETVLDTVGFDRLVSDADLVLSGEGKIDTQSLRGKVVIGVARRCKKHGVPLVALVGDIGDNIENAYEEGVSAVFSTNRVAVDFSVARTRSKSDMALTVDNLMRFLSRIGF